MVDGQSPEDVEFVRRHELTKEINRLNRIGRLLDDTLAKLPDLMERNVEHAVRKDLTRHWLRGARENAVAACNQLTIMRDGAKAVARKQNGKPAKA